MTINENVIQVCIDSVAADIADMYAQTKGVSTENALQDIMPTKTYALLLKPESGLYLESTEYVYDMLLAELRGDWERWKEI